MRATVIGQAVPFVALPCGVGLHASAHLALAVEAMCVIKHFSQCNEFQRLEEARTRREFHDDVGVGGSDRTNHG
jgi:hypothetical protein